MGFPMGIWDGNRNDFKLMGIPHVGSVGFCGFSWGMPNFLRLELGRVSDKILWCAKNQPFAIGSFFNQFRTFF